MVAKRKRGARRPAKRTGKPQVRFTARQGQYLAYLYWYRRLHRFGPSESEAAGYFRVSPSSAHQMFVKLEKEGLITRQQGIPRSIRVCVPENEIPKLEDEEGDATAALEQVVERGAGSRPLYSLDVYLIGGPVSEEFAGRRISRTIQIRGDQTLEDLHGAIFETFDRWDEHFYEFHFGKGPYDPKGKRYVLPEMLQQEGRESTIAGDLTQTTIDSLRLNVGQSFGYLFDYGDEWWHQINVAAVAEKVLRGRYPRVIKRAGKSPPQYLDWDPEEP